MIRQASPRRGHIDAARDVAGGGRADGTLDPDQADFCPLQTR